MPLLPTTPDMRESPATSWSSWLPSSRVFLVAEGCAVILTVLTGIGFLWLRAPQRLQLNGRGSLNVRIGHVSWLPGCSECDTTDARRRRVSRERTAGVVVAQSAEECARLTETGDRKRSCTPELVGTIASSASDVTGGAVPCLFETCKAASPNFRRHISAWENAVFKHEGNPKLQVGQSLHTSIPAHRFPHVARAARKTKPFQRPLKSCAHFERVGLLHLFVCLFVMLSDFVTASRTKCSMKNRAVSRRRFAGFEEVASTWSSSGLCARGHVRTSKARRRKPHRQVPRTAN